MAVLYTPHFAQFIDNNGNPLNGGKLFTYEAGTVTPKATYTTEAGDVPNTNPVVLDSAGRSVVFLDGSYKFRLEDALGNLIRETDDITAFSVQSASVDNIVANFTEDVVTAADSIIFSDASDSNKTKRDTIQGIIDLVSSLYATLAEVASGAANTILTASIMASGVTDATNGSITLFKGIIVNWGRYTGGANNPTVSFTTAYTSACYVVIPIGRAAAGTNPAILTLSSDPGLTSFTCDQRERSGGATATTSFYWIAVGK